MIRKEFGVVLAAALLASCRGQPAANEAVEGNNQAGPVENAASNAVGGQSAAPVPGAPEASGPAAPSPAARPPSAAPQPAGSAPPQPEAPATKRPGSPPPEPRAEPDPHAGHDMGNRAGTQR